MAIEFRCPNGHKLSCPDELAGRTAKCPKCGVAVQIPEAGSRIMTATDSGVSLPEVPSESNADIPAEAPAPASTPSGNGSKPGLPQTITFLCPNGHKLTSPATLQGRGGKCPHCGARFLIPTLEEQAAERAAAEAAAEEEEPPPEEEEEESHEPPAEPEEEPQEEEADAGLEPQNES